MEETEKRDRFAEAAAWKARSDTERENPRDLFKQVSHIALCMSFDLVDKLRYWEKETLQLTDEEIEKRIPHMSRLLEGLEQTYVHFSDLEL